MVDPIKDCAEINLYDPSLLPTLQCTLQCMWQEQKCITCTQTSLMSTQGGWKYTIAFHKLCKMNRHQMLKHLWQFWCYGNQSVIGNRGRWWSLRNRGDIALSPACWETTQTNKPPKHYTRMGGQNISSWYPEWPHRQCVGLAFRRSHDRGSLSAARLVICSPARIAVCNTWSSGGTALCRVGGATSQLDLPSLTPLSVAGCGWLQLGAPHWATSINYCK